MVLAELAEVLRWSLKVVFFTIFRCMVRIASAVLKLTDVIFFGTPTRLAGAALEQQSIAPADVRYHLQHRRLAMEETERRGEVETKQDLAWTEFILSLSQKNQRATMETLVRELRDNKLATTYREEIKMMEARVSGWRELLRQVTEQGCPPGSTNVLLQQYDRAHSDLDVPFATVRQSGQPEGANSDGANSEGANSDGANSEGANCEGANCEGAALAEGESLLLKGEEVTSSAPQGTEKEVTRGPSKRHTEMCRHWLAGGCKLKRCRFAHGADQLRPLPLEDQPDLSAG
eukprot:TRINITY_DN2265_c0_g1_i1.p1 TRINITY_DN2265_c0_g1~~TRINITY_DN2265_c0_g1_i1.p1  ORF type:complete len:314 (+),score=56.67 TRINITY_DN2265_c0_g1_i1:78-944(+)